MQITMELEQYEVLLANQKTETDKFKDMEAGFEFYKWMVKMSKYGHISFYGTEKLSDVIHHLK